MKILKDLLGTYNGKYKYSQGRVYLFITFFSLLATLAYLLLKGIIWHQNDYSDNEVVVIETLKWAFAALAIYVFGGRGLVAFGKNGYPPPPPPTKPEQQTPVQPAPTQPPAKPNENTPTDPADGPVI